MGLEILWAAATTTALVAAIVALVRSYRSDAQAEGGINLETNSRVSADNALGIRIASEEGVSDSQTKRLNDHYSAIGWLQSETRRQRSELRQLTRTVEALAASHGRQSAAIGELVRRAQSLPLKKGGKK